MIIGVPKEIKNNENRVGLSPGGVLVLKKNGHEILVEISAGAGSGFEDSDYRDAGAQILENKNELFERSEIITKVKEPLESEYELLREGQILYTYLHLASNAKLAEILLEKRVTGLAYETVQASDGSLPLLRPMSEVAGRMSVQIGAFLLQKNNGGRGVLLGGVPGVAPGEVVIVGGGVVGINAAKIASGMGASVSLLDIDKRRLVFLDDLFHGNITTLIYNEANIAKIVKKADLLIGAVLVAGARAPITVTEAMVKTMKKGSVIIDVAIDQGGTIETIDRVTSYDELHYVKHGVSHCSVPNLPGAVPRTSTLALEAATLPYLIKIANNGLKKVLLEDPSLMGGLNTFKGSITCQAVAESLGLKYKNPNGSDFWL
ncbi:MAG: alanine dehydrogenase [Eubacteriaceae bacterium]|nr:alanine dehydrogenase [Eubacteriaceae bacterium]